jgi:hypothetical protein
MFVALDAENSDTISRLIAAVADENTEAARKGMNSRLNIKTYEGFSRAGERRVDVFRSRKNFVRFCQRVLSEERG